MDLEKAAERLRQIERIQKAHIKMGREAMAEALEPYRRAELRKLGVSFDSYVVVRNTAQVQEAA